MLLLLLRFKAKNGHTRVPNPFKENPGLGRWFKNQRFNYKKGTLTEERKRWLDAVGFVWGSKRPRPPTTKDEDLWNKRYQELMVFQKETGHCRVPFPYPNNKQLGNGCTIYEWPVPRVWSDRIESKSWTKSGFYGPSKKRIHTLYPYDLRKCLGY